MRLLFASPEVFPLAKVGGLADVAASLPRALRALGIDARIVMPGYRQVTSSLAYARHCLTPSTPGIAGRVDVFESRLAGTDVPLYVVDAPALFDRTGSPYADPCGSGWPDEAERWLAFGHAVTALACAGDGEGWRPDIVHGNDWPCGFAHALLARRAPRPATVFTIHNLAYHGLLDPAIIWHKGLPQDWWHFDGLEFHGQIALIKGGLVWADKLTTVSPGYAREILGAAQGCGLDGLLRHRRADLYGILNGVDYAIWDPAHDPHLAANYGPDTLERKRLCKQALQQRFGLAVTAGPLLGFVGRLVTQKGIELLLDSLPLLVARGAQLVVVGAGAARFESALREFSRRHHDAVAVHIGFDEALAHQVEAGADVFLMPSLYEPCGLNQIYSLRYGTPPVVYATGGLADTVVEASVSSIHAGSGTGFRFSQPSRDALLDALTRALQLWRQSELWRRLQRNAMCQDFSWTASARAYQDLYHGLVAARPGANRQDGSSPGRVGADT